MTTLDTEVLPGGCVRQKTSGRGAFELMSPFAQERVAKLYEWGKKHRGDRNWESGCPFSRCLQSLFRHYNDYQMGRVDTDHGDNLAAIVFWASAMMHYEELIKLGLLPPDLDDRVSYKPREQLGAPVKEATEPLRIYVAGPISATTDEGLQDNLRGGRVIGDYLEKLGHHVFVPHRYHLDSGAGPHPVTGLFQAVGPEREYEGALRFDFTVIERWANALFYMRPSPGADRELALAERLGMAVYKDLIEVPDLRKPGLDDLSVEAIREERGQILNEVYGGWLGKRSK